MKIAIAVSRFNEKITQALLDGALARLSELGVDVAMVPVTHVPGAVELPLVAQQYARSHNFDAVICLGAVIRGETSHYDYVCQQVSYGAQKVALTHNIPIIFGVLTTENRAQALDRLGGSHGHKGRDSADAAVEMIRVMKGFDNVMITHDIKQGSEA
jgi:6,7-dimethyl-8-ribityllumazine synthase